jgi:hypothetical protein
MMTRILLASSITLLVAGCSLLTSTDTDFLPGPDASPDDTGPGDCSITGLTESLAAECRDGCDNDGDGLTDCEDSDCERFCCATLGGESLACNDECDNDGDNLIDCDDPDCSWAHICQSPPTLEGICRGTREDPSCCTDGGDGDADADADGPPDLNEGEDRCCSNGIDDDGDGVIDCDDSGCTPSSFCCGSETPHVDQPNADFDDRYWQDFGGRPGQVIWGDNHVVDWNDAGLFNGAASIEPVNLAFGISISFHVRVTEQTECPDPLRCPHIGGIALSPGPAPTSPIRPTWNLAVLATSSNHIVVVRGGRVLHKIGLDPQDPGFVEVSMDLTPSAGSDGSNGFMMILRVARGRAVCHDDGSTIGCRDEPEWISEELVLLEEDHILDTGGRGTYLMVLGTGTGVQVSDVEGQTIEISLRSCANPAAWTHGDDPLGSLGQEHVCWAAGGIRSPSISRISSAETIMLLEGTTRDISLAGYGTNNFSLGWAQTTDPELRSWAPSMDREPDHPLRFRPIDTRNDLNCMDSISYPGSCDMGVAGFPPPHAPGECESARGHRSPHIIPSNMGTHRVLFSEAISPGSSRSQISVADFSPAAADGGWTPRATPEHTLTAEEVSTRIGTLYRSLRDPVAICHPRSLNEDGDCRDGLYMMFLVGEREVINGSDGDADADADADAEGDAGHDADIEMDGDLDADGDDEPSPGLPGDDLIYVEYQVSDGFNLSYVVAALDTDELSNPLRGRLLQEPWIISDPQTETYFLWVTTSEPPEIETQIDLLLGPQLVHDHPLAAARWQLWLGSPVLRSRDLEILWPERRGDDPPDCSDGCLIGGATGLVVPIEGSGRDRLHMWVGITELHANDTPAVWDVRHLVQNFGLP